MNKQCSGSHATLKVVDRLPTSTIQLVRQEFISYETNSKEPHPQASVGRARARSEQQSFLERQSMPF